MRRSEQSQDSVQTEWSARDSADICFQFLDFLVDGPSSLLAIAGSFFRLNIDDRADLTSVIETAVRLCEHSWVECFRMYSSGESKLIEPSQISLVETEYRQILESEEPPDFAVDEIGVWFQITALGRTCWEAWVQDQPIPATGMWVLDDDCASGCIRICAENTATAEFAFDKWLTRNKDHRVSWDSRSEKAIEFFRLRSGAVVNGGVEVCWRYSPQE